MTDPPLPIYFFFSLLPGEVIDKKPGESSSSVSFGAVHFLMIFIIVGAAVVTGYLCLLNKKKVSV